MKNWLANARKQKNISQEDVAKEIGVTRQCVSAYETGKAYPSRKVMKRLVPYLELDLKQVYDDGGESAS